MSDHPKSNVEELETRADAPVETEVEVESEAEAEESKRTPWWKKLSVVIPVITGMIGTLTTFLALVLPLMVASKPAPSHDPTPPPVYLIPQASAATPVPTSTRRRDSRAYMAIVSTPAGLYMRSGPNEKTNSIIKLEQGAQVKVSKCRSTVYIGDIEGQWCQTMYKDGDGNSHRGWMFNAYLIEDSDEA
jgi:hypothetical protein